MSLTFQESGITTIRSEDLPTEPLNAIAIELDNQRQQARRIPPHFTGVVYERDCTVNSSQECSYSVAGPALKSLVGAPWFIEELQNLTGLNRLVLARKGYKYYEAGDYIGIHTDRQECDVTITMTFQDDAEPMHYWPQHHRLERNDLIRAFGNTEIFPDGGTILELKPREMNVFAGHDLPHSRPIHGKGTTAIMTACYMQLG